MHAHDISRWSHSHDFTGDFASAEKSTKRVLALTAAMMIIEIVAGLRFQSMALLADGWHMATHVAAFAITALAYALSRRYASHVRFTFGAGKIGVLGAYTSAVILGGIAVGMAGDSVWRLFSPQPIAFNEAIPIACLGLVVNVVSALLLGHDHDHGHAHGHEHEHGDSQDDHHHHGHDLNLRAAYIHVIADAVTSVLAITALTLGKFFGWNWLDPMMGIVGSCVIAQWAYSLLRQTNPILLDSEPEQSDLSVEIRKAFEPFTGTSISDLHVWQLGSGKFAAIVAIVADDPRPPQFYKELLEEHEELIHLTVEVNRCEPV